MTLLYMIYNIEKIIKTSYNILNCYFCYNFVDLLLYIVWYHACVRANLYFSNVILIIEILLKINFDKLFLVIFKY